MWLGAHMLPDTERKGEAVLLPGGHSECCSYKKSHIPTRKKGVRNCVWSVTHTGMSPKYDPEHAGMREP